MDLEHFGVGQLVDATRVLDAHLPKDVLGGARPDAMNVLERDFDALVGRDIDACDTGHVL
jgi:hypothetical protein